MRIRPTLNIVLILVLISYGLTSFAYWGIQYFNFQKSKNIFEKQREHINQIQENLNFLESHKKEIARLIKMGWFSRKNRLTAAEKIKQLNNNLILTNIIFEPEFYDCLDSAYALNINKIKIDLKASNEKDIYRFIERLVQHFPGFFLFNELKEGDLEGSFQGCLILDWISFGADYVEN